MELGVGVYAYHGPRGRRPICALYTTQFAKCHIILSLLSPLSLFRFSADNTKDIVLSTVKRHIALGSAVAPA